MDATELQPWLAARFFATSMESRFFLFFYWFDGGIRRSQSEGRKSSLKISYLISMQRLRTNYTQKAVKARSDGRSPE